MGRLDGKVALITGVASGIGFACAQRFAEEGAQIAGFDIAKPAPEAWSTLEGMATKCAFWEVDVREEEDLQASVSAAAKAFGQIDVLVNAAGVMGYGSVDTLESAEWDRVVDINLKGTFLACKAVLPSMMERGEGSIVNLASVEGIEGMQTQPAYNASKGGVVLLTKNMAVDYSAMGIRVNCLCPGLIETTMTAMLSMEEFSAVKKTITDMHLLGRMGKPEEVAAAALFLASSDASFVTGHALVVDGGFTAGRRVM